MMTGIVFLDVYWAFNKVYHEENKFNEMGLTLSMCGKLMGFYLSERSFQTRIGKKLSTSIKTEAGIQGALLSPKLYSIYTRK